MMEDKQEHLFRLVWKNCVILKEIFHFVRLYKKNKFVSFDDLQSLQEYKEREFIETIEYRGKEDELKLGYLPENGILKQVQFDNARHYERILKVNSNSIPYGVEIIKFGYFVKLPKFSELPNTVHTLKEVIINESSFQNSNFNENYYSIPPNITSIGFGYIPNISGLDIGWGTLTIPNTIKELSIDQQWNNEKIPLKKGDLPNSITNLEISDFIFKYSNFSKDILPTSLKKLTIDYSYISKYGDSYIDYFNKLFKCFPSTIEELSLFLNHTINEDSNFTSLTSIKKLSLYFYKRGFPSLGVLPFTLPTSITELKLRGVTKSLEIGSIPNNVKNLILEFDYSTTKDIHKFIKNKASLPSSITNLELNAFLYKTNLFPPFLEHLKIKSEISTSYLNELIKMVKYLPVSLTSIDLPYSDNEFDNNLSILPSTIKNIKFNKTTIL